MSMRTALRKWMGWLLIVCLLSGLTTPAFASQTTADLLRLEAVEGTVKLVSQTGKEVPVFEQMKLHNGYRISTDLASYAYISLDDTKVIKVDSLSEVEIRKQGNDLEVLLVSGSLFFNVTAPLKADENLNIRTSTTVTGIRGTSGVVKAAAGSDGECLDEVQIWEGSTLVKAEKPGGGGVSSTQVATGEVALASTAGSGSPQAPAAVQLTRMLMDKTRLPGFAAIEVVRDAALRQKLLTNGYNVEIIEAQAEQWLLADEDVKRTAQEALDNKVLEQMKGVEPVFPDSDSDSDSSSGGRAPAPTEPLVILTMNVDAQTINSYLDKDYVKDIIVIAGIESNHLNLDRNVTIPAGKSLAVNAGVTVSVGVGTTLQVDGSMAVAETLDNYGTLNNTSKNTLTVTGGIVNQNGAVLVNTGRIIAGAPLVNHGNAELHGTLSGALDNRAVATLDGTITGNVTNSGSFAMAGGDITGTVTLNDGTFTLDDGRLKKGVAVNAAAAFELNGGIVTGGLSAAVISRGGDVTLNAGVVDGGSGYAVSADGGTVRWNQNTVIRSTKSSRLLEISNLTRFFAAGVEYDPADMCYSGQEMEDGYKLASIYDDSLQAFNDSNAGDLIQMINGSIHITSFMMFGGDLDIAPITLDLNGNTLYVEALFGVAAADGLRIQNGIIDIRDPSAEILIEGAMWLDEVTIMHEHGIIHNTGMLDMDKSIVISEPSINPCIDTSDGQLEIRASKLSAVSDVLADIPLITGGAGLAACLITLDNTEITATGTTAVTLLDGAELTIGKKTRIGSSGANTIEVQGNAVIAYLGGIISNDGNGSAINWKDLSVYEAADLFPEPDECLTEIRSTGEFVLVCDDEAFIPPGYLIVNRGDYRYLVVIGKEGKATSSNAAGMSTDIQPATASNAAKAEAQSEHRQALPVTAAEPEQNLYVKKEEGEDE